MVRSRVGRRGSGHNGQLCPVNPGWSCTCRVGPTHFQPLWGNFKRLYCFLMTLREFQSLNSSGYLLTQATYRLALSETCQMLNGCNSGAKGTKKQCQRHPLFSIPVWNIHHRDQNMTSRESTRDLDNRYPAEAFESHKHLWSDDTRRIQFHKFLPRSRVSTRTIVEQELNWPYVSYSEFLYFASRPWRSSPKPGRYILFALAWRHQDSGHSTPDTAIAETAPPPLVQLTISVTDLGRNYRPGLPVTSQPAPSYSVINRRPLTTIQVAPLTMQRHIKNSFRHKKQD